MFHQYLAPVDPECPEVAAFNESLWGDPMTAATGVGDEIAEAWEHQHLSDGCERCREYSAANIEVR